MGLLPPSLSLYRVWYNLNAVFVSFCIVLAARGKSSQRG